MSKQLLRTLNGNHRGLFHDWLAQFEGEPRIAWYPSSGTDFRDLLYLSPAFARKEPGTKPDPPPPDIFLHTDYYPFDRSRFLDNRTIYRDAKSRIWVKAIEELPKCQLPVDDQLVTSPEGSIATNRVIFIDIEVTSSILGHYSCPVIYAFCENTVFCAERMLPNKARISHIVHVRYGGGLGGGGKSTGIWILNVLQKLQCEVFVTDSHYGHGYGDDYIYKKYPELAGDEDQSILKQIRKIPGERWSNHGDVSWNLVRKMTE